MTIPILIAVSLSLSTTNDYVYTILTSTNGIEGVGMGENVDYPMMRLEDCAFLFEAGEEIRRVKSSAITCFSQPSTNIAARTNIASRLVRRANLEAFARLTSTNALSGVFAESQITNLCTSTKAAPLAESEGDPYFHFKAPFDPGAGFADLPAGYFPIGVTTNLAVAYRNLKAAKLVSGASPYIAMDFGRSYRIREFKDELLYGFDTKAGWLPRPVYTNSWRIYSKEIGSNIGTFAETAVLRLGRFTDNTWGHGSVDGHQWTCDEYQFPGESYLYARIPFSYPSIQSSLEIAYAAVDAIVRCYEEAHRIDGTGMVTNRANHRVLYPLKKSDAEIRGDKIRICIDDSRLFLEAEDAIGATITPRNMRDIMFKDIGGTPEVGSFPGKWNEARVQTQINVRRAILVFRVGWHARTIEN